MAHVSAAGARVKITDDICMRYSIQLKDMS